VVKPADKKQVVSHLIEHHRISERLACRLVGLSRTAYRYLASPGNDLGLRTRMKALAAEYPRYGYLLLHGLLKGEGLVINKKRTYRVYTEESLQVRTKKRKKLQRPRLPMEVPLNVNERWSMDFVSDQLSNGRRFRVLHIVDDYSREMVGQLASVSITGNQVARFLDALEEVRGLPKSIVCDNGRVYEQGHVFLEQRNRCKTKFYSTWETNTKCLRRKPEWEIEKRVFEPTLVQIA
jgi:putative transposase